MRDRKVEDALRVFPQGHKVSLPDDAFLRCLENLLRRTFSPVRSVKRDLLIILSAGTQVASAASGVMDGAAGSALLTELILQLGMDVEAKRESLKWALVLSLYLAHLPIRSLSNAALCVSLRSSGAPPAVAAVVDATVARLRLPTEVLVLVREFGGEDLWWGRTRAGPLPRARGTLRAYSTSAPPAVHKLLHRVVCYPCTRIAFSTGDVAVAAWADDQPDTLCIRCTSVRPLVALLRRERCREAPRAAAVLRIGGLGDVLL